MTGRLVAVRLQRWGPDDLMLLEQLLGDPVMTTHLGGPESHEAIVVRHARYEQWPVSDPGGVYKIVDVATGQPVGSVVYWEETWRDEAVYEIGWSVLPAFQGRGYACAGATQAIALARAEGRHRHLYASPAVDNAPSNALCRKLGFELLGEEELEYPRGQIMRCNVWRHDLSAPHPL